MSPSDRERPLESELGVMTVPINRAVSKGMKNTEHLWSQQMVTIIETGCIENTDRVAWQTLNTLLHREGSDQTLKLRTITDLCDRHGKDIEAYQEAHAEEVLKANGFEPETGLPQKGADLPEGILPPVDGCADTSDERIQGLIDGINEKREGRERIPDESRKPYDVEAPDDAVVEVSLDEVLSKRQKEHRRKGVESQETQEQQKTQTKKRPSVGTSVAHIRVNGKRYILTAHDMRSLCIKVLAFLLNAELLSNRQLIIFSDGAAEIKTCVDEIFGFCCHYVILDWFHLKKHCYELLSMILISGKSNRDMRHNVMTALMRILWVGNVTGAIDYLKELPASCIKSEEKRQDLISYLQRKEPVIACYAIRRKLGLRISSNPVEKANDLTVASRQKHRGMSWSYHGSWHFAALTALYLNHEEDTWHNTGSLSFKMVPVSTSKSIATTPVAA